MWAADCRLISHNITPFAVQSTIFEQTTPTLTESVIVSTRRWNFPGKWNSLSQWYCDKMHAVCSSKHCNLRLREHQLYGDIKAMENVITFTGFWYLIKRTTNWTGIRTNWMNCPLCKVLLNLYIFPVQNKNCTETYLGPLHRSYIIWVCSFRWIQKRILDLRTDFEFLSANPNPDFWSGESFLKKDSLDLKSEESKSRLTD